MGFVVVWGKKVVRSGLGFVADFCPICRDVRVCRVSRVGVAEHLYFIALDAGQLSHFALECLTCGAPQSADPSRYSFLAPSASATDDVAGLAAATFPNLRVVHGARLDLEARLRAGEPVPKEARRALLTEPFGLLESVVRQRDKTSFDVFSGTGCLTTIFLPIVVGIAACNRTTSAGSIALGLFVFGTLFTLVQIALGHRRFVRRAVLPALVQALRPLRPTSNELEACLGTCRARNWEIGKGLSSDAILKAM